MLLLDLGYAPPSEVLAFNELAAAVDAVTDLLAALRSANATDDNVQTIQHLATFVIESGRAIKTLNDFSANIQANFAGSQLLTETDIVAELPGKLVDYLIVKFLEDYHPTVFGVLLVAGVVDLDDIEDAPSPFHVPYRKRWINWDQLPNLLADPVGTIKANFDGGDELLYERFLYLLREFGPGPWHAAELQLAETEHAARDESRHGPLCHRCDGGTADAVLPDHCRPHARSRLRRVPDGESGGWHVHRPRA